MIDLNDLKEVNDTYGHDYGNIYLQNISNVICNTFIHSPVFRIGGDEFAVVLKNNDYDKIETLVEEFNRTLSECTNLDNQWEQLSAAIGYALYDPQKDSCADDVFQRADKNMYQNKKTMKKGR